MSQVEFEEGAQQSKSSSFYTKKSKYSLIDWLIKTGIAKDEQSTQKILVGITLFFFIMSILVFIFF
ncbi:MAG: hypothetical protein WCW87_03945 [Candidatus Paceibacterota bacterium]